MLVLNRSVLLALDDNDLMRHQSLFSSALWLEGRVGCLDKHLAGPTLSLPQVLNGPDIPLNINSLPQTRAHNLPPTRVRGQ